MNDFYKDYDPEFPVSAKIRSFIASCLIILLLVVVMLILIPSIVLTLGKLKNTMIKHLGGALGRTSLWMLGVRVRYDYSQYQPEKPAVFITNHSSTLDLFAIISMKLPNVRYVAKKEIQYNPLFFVIGHLTGQIFIDRQRSKETIEQLRKMYDKVRSQQLSLMIAPEGTREHADIVGPFKKGAFHIARDVGYDIVPMYIDGAYHLCPGSKLLTLPGTVTLRSFPPVCIKDLDETELNAQIESFRKFYNQQYELTANRFQSIQKQAV